MAPSTFLQHWEVTKLHLLLSRCVASPELRFIFYGYNLQEFIQRYVAENLDSACTISKQDPRAVHALCTEVGHQRHMAFSDCLIISLQAAELAPKLRDFRRHWLTREMLKTYLKPRRGGERRRIS